MRPLKLIILSLFFCTNLFSQQRELFQDTYKSGKLYLSGETVGKGGYGIGLWTCWYENGQKRSEEYRDTAAFTKYINCWTIDGKQICTDGNGLYIETWSDIGFMDDSTTFTIKDSNRQGPFVSYIHLDTNEIKIAKGNLINGVKQGETYYYHESGEIDCISVYINNKENGIYKKFYKNGHLKETGFRKEFTMEGNWFYYDSSGILTQKIVYEHNKKRHEVEYYENGSIKQEGDYVQLFIKPKKKPKITKAQEELPKKRTNSSNIYTLKNGNWTTYDLTGKPVKTERYLNGKLIKNGM